jgi:adenine/guanine phosphoribosyltransferase-like PRPP-binding protein
MQQHIYYIKFALHFADMQIPELVTVFNAQAQSRGWSSMRAYHDQALLDEFQRRGIDTIAVSDVRGISFAHPVRYKLPDNKLIAIR